MKMKDIAKEVKYNENGKHYFSSLTLLIPEELLIKIYDKVREVYEETGYHPHLLILSHEYARWFREYLQINEYLKINYNSISRFIGLEIKVTHKDDTIEVY